MIATRSPFRADAPEPEARLCEVQGCTECGDYRAPKSRSNLREYRWFCLKHVREYNLSWDYYKGMSEAEIEANMRSDTAWQRPTWPLGRLGGTAHAERDLVEELHINFGARAKPAAPPKPTIPSELNDALNTLGLVWPVNLGAVKAKYKTLAKRHHPDANNGDKQAEEKFKSINLAYRAITGKFAGMLHREAASA